MTGAVRSPSALEQDGDSAETIVEVSHAERIQATGGQLEGERKAVEGPDDASDRRSEAGMDLQPRVRVAGTFEEQLPGSAPLEVAKVGVSRWETERREAQHDFAREAERLPAGGQHRQVWAGVEHVDHEVTHSLDDVFAVVEHEQPTVDVDDLGEQRGQRSRTVRSHPEGSRRRGGDISRSTDGGERDHAASRRFREGVDELERGELISGVESTRGPQPPAVPATDPERVDGLAVGGERLHEQLMCPLSER